MKITKKDTKNLNRKDNLIYVILSFITIFFFWQINFDNYPNNKFQILFLTLICFNFFLCYLKVKNNSLNSILVLYFLRSFSTIISLLIIIFYFKEKLLFNTDLFYINLSLLLLAPYLLISIKGSSIAKRKQTKRFINDIQAYLYRKESKKISIETKEGKYKIYPSEIIYIKSKGRDKIFFIDKQHFKKQQCSFGELVTYKYNFEELLKLLPKKNFKRINNSVIINTKYENRVKGNNQFIKIKKGAFEKQFSLSSKFYTLD